jgi:hypothetical protein
MLVWSRRIRARPCAALPLRWLCSTADATALSKWSTQWASEWTALGVTSRFGLHDALCELQLGSPSAVQVCTEWARAAALQRAVMCLVVLMAAEVSHPGDCSRRQHAPGRPNRCVVDAVRPVIAVRDPSHRVCTNEPGSGKSLAFLLPIVERMKVDEVVGNVASRCVVRRGVLRATLLAWTVSVAWRGVQTTAPTGTSTGTVPRAGAAAVGG